jgi:hypothetical protein
VDGFIKRSDLLTWCRRNWSASIVLALVVLGCAAIWKIYADKAQRERLTAAFSQIVPIRDAVNEQLKKTGKFPSDFRPFIKQSRYSVEHSKLGRIGFSIRAEGQRLRVLFDPDQGPFADKALIVDGNESNGTISWSCSVPGVPDRYVPGSCR